MTKPPGYIANLDSASAMLRATARSLKSKAFPAIGMGAPLKPVVRSLDHIPRVGREVLCASGANEAIRPSAAGREKVTSWMISKYPKRQYPGAFIDSSSGALVHLAAAMGTPGLPQTFRFRSAKPMRTPTTRAPVPRPGPSRDASHSTSST